MVDITVWFLERVRGTAVHSGEQRSNVGQLVSSDRKPSVELCRVLFWSKETTRFACRPFPVSVFLSSSA